MITQVPVLVSWIIRDVVAVEISEFVLLQKRQDRRDGENECGRDDNQPEYGKAHKSEAFISHCRVGPDANRCRSRHPEDDSCDVPWRLLLKLELQKSPWCGDPQITHEIKATVRTDHTAFVLDF